MTTKKRSTKTPKQASQKKSRAGAKRTSVKMPKLESFRVAPSPKPFVVFRITRQTFYWSLLVLVIVALQLWIVALQLDIARLTESIIAQ